MNRCDISGCSFMASCSVDFSGRIAVAVVEARAEAK